MATTVGRCTDRPTSGFGSSLGEGRDTKDGHGETSVAGKKADNNMTTTASQLMVAEACKKKNGVAALSNTCLTSNPSLLIQHDEQNDKKSSSSTSSSSSTTSSVSTNGETGMMMMKNNNRMMVKKKVEGVVTPVVNNPSYPPNSSKNNPRINGSSNNTNSTSNVDVDNNDTTSSSSSSSSSCSSVSSSSVAKGGGGGLLILSQPSIPNLRSRKDKQQQATAGQQPQAQSPPQQSQSQSSSPQPAGTATRRSVPESSARKRRRSSRHETKPEQQQQQTTTTTSTNESISCCCLEKKTQGENAHENNNASPFISQPNNKGSLELSSPSPIFGLPLIRDGLALNNDRTKTAAGGGPGSTGHTGAAAAAAQPTPLPPRPCTPIQTAASASSVVNCAALNSSPSSKDSQNFDYNCNKETVTPCKWKNCDIVLDPDLLMAHIREKHVESQEGSEAYVCFWDGCKVYAKRSCSMSWLERHILSHSGDKPFKCIVDGCDMRFPSHHGLERHVNSHFNTQQPAAPKPQKLREDTPTKLWKKKKLKRKRPQLVRTGDFFDSGIMERLQQELVALTRITQIDLEGSTDSITFHGTVIARRTEESGKVKVLLHWTPENIFPDCWVPESQVQEMYKRVIPLTSLPQDTAATLHSSFYRRHRYRKHRRK